jgi:hypothetical protein
MLGKAESGRDPALTFLISIIQVFQAKILSVSEKPQKIPGIVSACHDQDLIDACVHQHLDGIIDHGFPVDGKQVLVRDLRQWIHPGSETSRQYNPFHALSFPAAMNKKSNMVEWEALYHIFTYMNNKNLAITGLHPVTEEGKNIV